MEDKDRFFSWPEKSPWGLAVSKTRDSQIDAEVFYEDEMIKLKDREIFMGSSIDIKRFYYTGAVFIFMIAILLGRAFWMQGLASDYYQAKADANRLRTKVLVPPRGLIVDRQGIILAENESSFDVVAVPLDLPQEEDLRNMVYGKIARITGTDIASVAETVNSTQEYATRITLVRDIPYEQAVQLKIALADQPSISIDHGLKRKYRQSGDLLSLGHVLGYVGKISPTGYEKNKEFGYMRNDLIGKSGVEVAYEFWLSGKRGELITEVDALGRKNRVVKKINYQSGKLLELSLDLRLQKAAEQAVKDAIKENENIKKGSVVAMDPKNGAILAAVSWPAFDNNFFSGKVSSTVYQALLEDEDRPLLPRAWAGLYPSGSTIKPVFAVAALAEGIITANTKIYSTGGIWVSNRFFPDWRPGGHGVTNVRKAIAWSVNTFFYLIGGGGDDFEGMGANLMAVWLEKFGFGKTMGLDIPGENAGLVPTPQWRVQKRNERWYIGDTYNFSIGQGDFLATPMQIAVATAQIANGGFRIRPHFVKNDEAYQQYKQMNPMEMSDSLLADERHIQTVKAGMRDTVLYGSGRALYNFPIAVAGKTGTAQWRRSRPNHAWFTCFAPYDEPRIVLTVLLEEGEEGSETAIPVARKVLNTWLQIEDEMP